MAARKRKRFWNADLKLPALGDEPASPEPKPLPPSAVPALHSTANFMPPKPSFTPGQRALCSGKLLCTVEADWRDHDDGRLPARFDHDPSVIKFVPIEWLTAVPASALGSAQPAPAPSDK